jgi:hypothetical protein
MGTSADCKCGHKFVEHRQLKIINYCIGDVFLCKCEKYDSKYDLEKGKKIKPLIDQEDYASDTVMKC